MPYQNLPKNQEIQNAMERCVAKVKAKGKVDNPYAVCYSSVMRNQVVRETLKKYKKNK